MEPLLATTIQTDRLILEPLAEEDVEALFVIAQDPASIEDFQVAAKTEADVRTWVEPTLRDPDNLAWTVRLEDRVVGLFDLCLGPEDYESPSRKELEGRVSPVDPKVARVGYFMDRGSQNRGFATEALRGIVGWAFQGTTLVRIEAGVTAGNLASSRILEKVGFVREAFVPESFRFRGTMFDSEYYFLEKTS